MKISEVFVKVDLWRACMTTPDTTICTFSFSCPVNYLDQSPTSHWQVPVMCSCGRFRSPRFLSFSPGCAGSIPWTAISLQLSRQLFWSDLGVNFNFARSQSCVILLQVASVSMTIGMVTVRSILGRDGSSAQMGWRLLLGWEQNFGAQKIPNHARFVMRSHGCLWRLWLSTLRYTEFLLAFAAVSKGRHFTYLNDPDIHIRWYDMIWLWYDMIWYDMIWYDVICTSLCNVSAWSVSYQHGFLHMDLFLAFLLRLGTSVSWCCSLWLKLPWSWIAVGSWLCCCCRCSWEAADGHDGCIGLWSPMISHVFEEMVAM